MTTLSVNELTDDIIDTLKVKDLKAYLREFGLPHTGKKAVLQTKLKNHISNTKQQKSDTQSEEQSPTPPTPPPTSNNSEINNDKPSNNILAQNNKKENIQKSPKLRNGVVNHINTISNNSNIDIKSRLEERKKRFNIVSEKDKIENRKRRFMDSNINNFDIVNIKNDEFDDKIKLRQAKFGIVNNESNKRIKLSQTEKIEIRKERFGLKSDQDKIEERKKRFGNISESDKIKLRKNRFGNNDNNNVVNNGNNGNNLSELRGKNSIQLMQMNASLEDIDILNKHKNRQGKFKNKKFGNNRNKNGFKFNKNRY